MKRLADEAALDIVTMTGRSLAIAEFAEQSAEQQTVQNEVVSRFPLSGVRTQDERAPCKMFSS